MGSTPYWGPDESAHDIIVERVYLAGDLLSGIGYGMQFILYISCALYLWKTRKLRGKQSIYLLIYITLLFCVETMYVAVQAHAMQATYIDYRNYPGGPLQYFLITQRLVIVMFYATLFILTFLSDLLVLWRCWIIWGGSATLVSYAVVAFPFLMILASFAMGTLWMRQVTRPKLLLSLYYVISLSVNILLTILITTRLLIYRRKAISSLPEHANRYFSLAAIFVESAALYSIVALLFVVTYTLSNPISSILLVTVSSAQQIAGYLIIYRLAMGWAWNQEISASNEPNLQTMHFLSTPEGTTTTASTNLEAPMDGTPFTLPYSQDLPLHITVEEKNDEEEVPIRIAQVGISFVVDNLNGSND